MYAQESIDLLAKSGIMFQKNTENGIDPMQCAELLTASGVVICEKVTWISFHSSYDFGYLIKLLTNKDLPNTEAEFLEMLKIFFPNVFDIKYLMKSCRNLKGGLEEVARQLEVILMLIYYFLLLSRKQNKQISFLTVKIERFGPQHQAGSDSLLTGLTFFKLKEVHIFLNFDKCNLDENEKIELSSIKMYLNKFKRAIKQDKIGRLKLIFLNTFKAKIKIISNILKGIKL